LGRTAELAQLQGWLVEDRCRLVAILGLGGMGKTTLAAQAVRSLADQFEVVIWRSLVNAPPPAELLSPLLQLLTQEDQVIPQSLDEQLRLFLHALEQRRILLVLDNLESILAADTAGAYRAGYEPYGQLIRQIATRNHQSHLLLTSRERPHGFALLEGDSHLVRSLPLAGLDETAGQALLARRGLHRVTAEAVNEAAALIERYSGNPLALKLVAETVEAIFGGDIAEFLTEATIPAVGTAGWQ
jgi:predicted ATPase